MDAKCRQSVSCAIDCPREFSNRDGTFTDPGKHEVGIIFCPTIE
jgi:hypothetical protein